MTASKKKPMGRPQKGYDAVVFVRVSKSMLVALDKMKEKAMEESPGAILARSDIIRMILYDAIGKAEGEVAQ